MSDSRTFQRYNSVTGAVVGSLAYDFGHPDLYPGDELAQPAPRPARRPRPAEKTAPRPATRTRTRTGEIVLPAARPAQSLAPLTVVGFVAAAVLMVLVLIAQIRVTTVADEATILAEELEQLRAEQVELTVLYETTFNYSQIEDYAVNELGMREPREEQVYYLSGVSSSDRAEVFVHENEDLFRSGLQSIAESILAYFGH